MDKYEQMTRFYLRTEKHPDHPAETVLWLLRKMGSLGQVIERWDGLHPKGFIAWMRTTDIGIAMMKSNLVPKNKGMHVVPLFLAADSYTTIRDMIRELESQVKPGADIFSWRRGRVMKRKKELCLQH